MDYIFFVAALIIFFTALGICNSVLDKRRKERFKRRLLDEFGGRVNEDYSKERLECITGYSDFHKIEDPFYVDDITWNDLEGDRLLRRVNYSYSSIGDEYLYFCLRHPTLFIEDRDKFEEKIDYITNNEKDRLNLQILFATLGRMGKYSVYKYIDLLKTLDSKSKAIFIINWIIYALIIAFIFINTPVGLVVLCLYVCVNIIFYLRLKSTVGIYICSFEYILKILDCSEKFVKIAPDIYNPEKEELRKLRKKLSKIKSGNILFLKQGKGQGTGDIVELIITLSNMVTLADLFVFYSMLDQVRNNVDEIDRIVTILAKCDCEISVAAFRKSLPYFCKPDLDCKEGMSAKCLFHPLIDNPVDNDFDIKSGMLVTGTNASGKSTFLRTILVNALLSQCINTSLSKEYHGLFYCIYSSMSLKDSLLEGDSYYMAEIKSIRRILNAADGEIPVLCTVDEVLRGTNTVERIAAACQIMKSLARPNVCFFAATHDYELTELLKDSLTNCHFTEEISEDDIKFNYKLVEGPCNSRNAIKLLSLMGYSKTIVQNAVDMTSKFIETNSWELV